MTIYLEKKDSSIRMTCLDPVFLGFIKLKALSLGSFCQGRIESRMPQGYWVSIGPTKGFFKTNLSFNHGQKKDFWIAREEIMEGSGVKPVRLQDHPLSVPLSLYNGFVRLLAEPTQPLEVTDLEVFQWLRDKGVKNPIKLNQTGKIDPAVQQLWGYYQEDIIPWKGGHMLIEEGRTLTAVDINTSLYADGGSRVLKTDEDIKQYWEEAIPVVIELIRIRYLGGMILVDLPRLKRPVGDFLLKKFVPHLKEIEVESFGLTRGGLWELVRPRRVPSLKQQGS